MFGYIQGNIKSNYFILSKFRDFGRSREISFPRNAKLHYPENLVSKEIILQRFFLSIQLRKSIPELFSKISSYFELLETYCFQGIKKKSKTEIKNYDQNIQFLRITLSSEELSTPVWLLKRF